jgi:hypothetical protein
MPRFVGRSDDPDSEADVERKDMCKVYGLPDDEVTYVISSSGHGPII